MDVFYRSEQGETAEKLLSAYGEGSADEIKHVVDSSYTIPHLDHMVNYNTNQVFILMWQWSGHLMAEPLEFITTLDD